MEVSARTKISELIKFNAKSVDAISTLAKPFEKLRNPILRKIMASRVTVAEAAKMGGVQLEDFQRVLKPLGFNFVEIQQNEGTFKDEIKPEWLLSAEGKDICFYDVRPIIDDGADPLKEILHRFKGTEPGKILCVINSFVPTPLIHLLKQEKAEDSFVEKTGNKEFRTYFLKKNTTNDSGATGEEKVLMESEETFVAVCNRFHGEQLKSVDVRALEMPGPMETIITAVKELKTNEALYVNHKRVPIYLLEELADKDYCVHIFNKAENDVKLLIYPR